MLKTVNSLKKVTELKKVLKKVIFIRHFTQKVLKKELKKVSSLKKVLEE